MDIFKHLQDLSGVYLPSSPGTEHASDVSWPHIFLPLFFFPQTAFSLFLSGYTPGSLWSLAGNPNSHSARPCETPPGCSWQGSFPLHSLILLQIDWLKGAFLPAGSHAGPETVQHNWEEGWECSVALCQSNSSPLFNSWIAVLGRGKGGLNRVSWICGKNDNWSDTKCFP